MRLPARPWTSVHEPVLGTRLELRVGAARRADAEAAQQAALREIARLEAVFSVFDGGSELSRWCRAPVGWAGEVSADLATVLRAAADWQERSGGALHPLAGRLGVGWARAQERGVPPGAGEVAAWAASIRGPAYAVEGTTVRILADCSGITLNALAKGYIVDRAVAAVAAGRGVRGVTVSCGGDLCHRGEGSVIVGVENPVRAYDNEAPLARVELANGGMATSGSTRRGYTIGGRWYSHVLDPRTGWPVDTVLSATVVAADALTADAVATVASVLNPEQSLAFVVAQAPDGVACLVVDRGGAVHTSAGWAALALPRPSSPG